MCYQTELIVSCLGNFTDISMQERSTKKLQVISKLILALYYLQISAIVGHNTNKRGSFFKCIYFYV